MKAEEETQTLGEGNLTTLDAWFEHLSGNLLQMYRHVPAIGFWHPMCTEPERAVAELLYNIE